MVSRSDCMEGKKKPGFRRHDAHKKAKLSASWRKPRGRQNKVRLHKRGYKRGPSVGFGSPGKLRGTVKGLRPVRVATLKELEGLDPKREGAILTATLGARKREALLTHAKALRITLLNLDAEQQLARITARRAATKERRLAAKKKTAKSLEEEAKKAADGKKATAEDAKKVALQRTVGAEEQKKVEQTAEERKKAEEQAKAKVLTKKQ